MKIERIALVMVSLFGGGCGDSLGEKGQPGEEAVSRSVSALSVVPDATVAGIDMIPVEVPKRFSVPYLGAAMAEFPDGLPLSLGSGLRMESRRGCGCDTDVREQAYTLVGLSDRGPNGDAPDFLDSSGIKHPSKSYLVPAFTPQLVTVRVHPAANRAVVTHVEKLRFGRQDAVGLPSSAFTTEIGVDESLRAYPSSAEGIDPEGLDFDERGDAWVCEEYGPSLMKVKAHSGQISKRLLPGSGLPAVLASRQVNRGFEGVAVAPSGKVYGLVQSTLDVDGKTKGTAQFIRLVEYDPHSGATRMFAYPHDVAAYKKSGDAKMGDLFALDDSRFVTIEAGKGKDGNLRNVVYQFDISGATDLSGVVLATGANAGKELEYGTAAEVAAQLSLATKSLVVDLRAYGYIAEKSEGLAMLDDRTLVVVNDQDFGATAVVEGDANSTDPTKYVVDGAGLLTFDGAPSPGTYRVHALTPGEQQTTLFVVHLQAPLASLCAR
jgi:hypothetical protein